MVKASRQFIRQWTGRVFSSLWSVLLMFLYINGSSATLCYTCDNVNNGPGCADSFNSTAASNQQSTTAWNRFYNSNSVPASFNISVCATGLTCYKTKTVYIGVTYVSRQCLPVKATDRCITVSADSGYVVGCTCTTDFCNQSPRSISVTSLQCFLLMISSILLFHLHPVTI